MQTKEIISYNRPHKTTVAIDCRHIGDDNDYSCFLADCIYKLWLYGEKKTALKLANTDPMLVENFTADGLDKHMEDHTKFLAEQKRTHDAYYKLYRD